jgi:hypothetical protein
VELTSGRHLESFALLLLSRSKQFSVSTPLLSHLLLPHGTLESTCTRRVPLPNDALAYLAFSTNSLLLPAVMPSPSSMLYYACHPQQLRSMIQWCAHAARILLRNCRQIVPR